MIARFQNGIGLMNILITLLILSGGLLLIGGLQTQAMRDTQQSGLQQQAMTLAEQRLDQFRNLAQAQDLETLADGAEQIRVGGIVFQRNWQVIPRPNGDKEIRLTIAWTDPRPENQGTPATLTLSTVITSRLPATEAGTVLPPATPVTLTTTTTTTASCGGGGGMMGGGCGGGMM